MLQEESAVDVALVDLSWVGVVGCCELYDEYLAGDYITVEHPTNHVKPDNVQDL